MSPVIQVSYSHSCSNRETELDASVFFSDLRELFLLVTWKTVTRGGEARCHLSIQQPLLVFL